MSESMQSKKANSDFPGIEDVSPQEVFEKRENLQIIDVRRPDEYTGELGHIAGSTLVTLDLLPQKIGELKFDQTTVFICRSGQRSAQATQFAKENGFNDVFNMAGGMMAWNQEQLPVQGREG